MVAVQVPASHFAIAGPQPRFVHAVPSQPVGLCWSANATLNASALPPLQ